MSNYQRLISYIYTYEGGIKGKNIGFVKMETRNGQSRITVNVKKIFVGGNPMGVYLLSNLGELQIGTLFARNGVGEFRTAVNSENIEDSGRGIEEFYGLSVHDVESAWRAYTTIWEDAVAHAAEVELAEVTSENLIKKRPEAEMAVKENTETLPISEEIERELELEKKLEAEEAIEAPRREYWRRDGMSVRESLVEMPRAVELYPVPKPSEEVCSAPVEEVCAAPVEEVYAAPVEEVCTAPVKEICAAPVKEIFVAPAQDSCAAATKELCSPVSEGQIPAPMKEQCPEFESAGPDMTPRTPGPEILQQPAAAVPAEDENDLRNHQQMWNFLRKKCAKIRAFDYAEGCEILTIKPQDIGLLPRDNWVYGNNSFLLHGYYNYRYLIMARLENPAGMPRYLLGVPGNYYSNEKYMAAMFGFPNFVLSKNQTVKDGRFGYWYSDIKIGD